MVPHYRSFGFVEITSLDSYIENNQRATFRRPYVINIFLNGQFLLFLQLVQEILCWGDNPSGFSA